MRKRILCFEGNLIITGEFSGLCKRNYRVIFSGLKEGCGVMTPSLGDLLRMKDLIVVLITKSRSCKDFGR